MVVPAWRTLSGPCCWSSVSAYVSLSRKIAINNVWRLSHVAVTAAWQYCGASPRHFLPRTRHKQWENNSSCGKTRQWLCHSTQARVRSYLLRHSFYVAIARQCFEQEGVMLLVVQAQCALRVDFTLAYIKGLDEWPIKHGLNLGTKLYLFDQLQRISIKIKCITSC